MSSFVHSKEHFIFIQHAINVYLSKSDTNKPINQNAIPYDLRREWVNESCVKDFINSLIILNVDSYNEQYKQNVPYFTVSTFDTFKGNFSAYDFLKALVSLEYQIELQHGFLKKLSDLIRGVSLNICMLNAQFENSKFWEI